jgi:hypothetical protein
MVVMASIHFTSHTSHFTWTVGTNSRGFPCFTGKRHKHKEIVLQEITSICRVKEIADSLTLFKVIST